MNLLKSNQNITAALVAAVVSIVVTFLFSSNSEDATHSSSDNTTDTRMGEGSHNLGNVTQGHSNDGDSVQLSILQQQMLEIEQKINYIKEQQQQLASLEEYFSGLKVTIENTEEGERLNTLNSPAQSYPLSQIDPIDVQAIEEVARQDNIALQNNLENKFHAEDVDNAWAQDAESKLTRVLEELNANQPVSVAGMECKTSTCRLEVVHDPGVDLSMFQLMLSTEMSEDLPNAAVIENDIGTTFYLTKDSSAFVRAQ